MPLGRSRGPELLPAVHGVCCTSDLENRLGYVTQVESVSDDRPLESQLLRRVKAAVNWGEG